MSLTNRRSSSGLLGRMLRSATNVGVPTSEGRQLYLRVLEWLHPLIAVYPYKFAHGASCVHVANRKATRSPDRT